jgi:phosphatidylinositol glycan class W
MMSYQYILSKNGMQYFIENASRHCNPVDQQGETSMVGERFCHFFAANREGILGCVGYLVLYLASEDIARFCLWRCEERSRGKRLALVTVLSWIVHFIFVSCLGLQVSRRSTNASFVTWTSAHNITILFLTWLAFSLGTYGVGTVNKENEANPPIFAAVNRHGLLVFILANLMTGVVNLSMDTLNATNVQAIIVIFLYLFAIGFVALVLDWKLTPKPKSKIKDT